MKRVLSLLLTAVLLSALCLPARADGEEEPNRRVSEYCEAASMSDYRELFRDAESGGMGRDMTRAMLAGILYNIFGSAEDAETIPSDVDASRWYAAGTAWALKKNIIPNDGNGTFSPDMPITREAFLITLYRCANAYGVSLPAINACTRSSDGRPDGTGGADRRLHHPARRCDDRGYGRILPLSRRRAARRWRGDHPPLSRSQRVILTALPISTVAESEPVSDDWFNDVCFIGHSQIVGMQKYSGLSGPDYYAVVGHTAQAVVDYEFYELPDGRYGTLSDALHAKSYGKVYIMLGINDSSLRDDRVERFMNPMRTILDLVKETQPGAKIYLLSLVPVGRYTPMNELYNPDSTVFYSQLVKTLSREYDTEYIDLFRMMCDKAGYFLNSFNSGDGIHIQSDRYPEIAEYLKRHT